MRITPFRWLLLLLALAAGSTLACVALSTSPSLVSTSAPSTTASTIVALSTETRPSPIAPATPCPSGNCAGACLARIGDLAGQGASPGKQPKAAGPFSKMPANTLMTYPLHGDRLGPPQRARRVRPDLAGLQKDQATQKAIWEYFAALIPTDQRKELTYYVVSTDGRGGMLASVEQFAGSGQSWALVVDPADASKPRALTSTLLHEFGHLLTLNSTQVTPDRLVLENPDSRPVYERESAKCQTYFASGGCSLPGSYINRFFHEFWPDIYDEWTAVDQARGQDNYSTLLALFYGKHAGDFITPYAATSPEEDIAETWSYFVLNPRPADDSVAHRKVLFFYDQPELVSLRSQIAANICLYAASH